MNNLFAALWPNPSPVPKFDAAHQALLDLQATIAIVQHDLADVDARDRQLAAEVDACGAAVARIQALDAMQIDYLAADNPEAAEALQAERDNLALARPALERAAKVADKRRVPLGVDRAAITERLAGLRTALPAAEYAARLELLRKQGAELIRIRAQELGLRDCLEANWRDLNKIGRDVPGNTPIGAQTFRDVSLGSQLTVPKMPEFNGLTRNQKEAEAAITECGRGIDEALGIEV